MSKEFPTPTVLLVLVCIVTAGTALAEPRGNDRVNPGSGGSEASTGGREQRGSAESTGAIDTVPQYWLADAEIFIGNAHNTASVMKNEHALSLQAPQVIGSQAQFLVSASQRAIGDLSGLQEHALATHPPAVPAIRRTIEQLQAAEIHANRLAVQANRGSLGPDYQATINATVDHLANAKNEILSISQAFPQIRP